MCALTGCNLVITHSQWCFICCHNKANVKQTIFFIHFHGRNSPISLTDWGQSNPARCKVQNLFPIVLRSFRPICRHHHPTVRGNLQEKIGAFWQLSKEPTVGEIERKFSRKYSATSLESEVINFPQNIHVRGKDKCKIANFKITKKN